MKQRAPFTNHALERIAERYDVRLTKKQQLAFGKILSNPRFTIKLINNRLACYFERKWYLLAVSTYKMPTNMETSYVVQTFLRLEDATEDDRLILHHNERYIKINDDAFNVLAISQPKLTDLPYKKLVELPSLTEDEVPIDQFQSADHMLKRYCDDKR